MEFSREQVREILERIEARLAIMRKGKYEFYKESGISSALYSYWNTGKSKPTQKNLRKIADYLGVSYEWLVTGIGEEKQPEQDDDTMRIRQALKDRPELRILFSAAEDAPASEILNAAAQIMKYKEQSR